jgi:hypothetical protein
MPSGDAAADITDLVEGGVLADLAFLIPAHGEIRERGGTR